MNLSAGLYGLVPVNQKQTSGLKGHHQPKPSISVALQEKTSTGQNLQIQEFRTIIYI